MAWAPKLMRRAKGVFGVRNATPSASSSSMAFSSKADSEVDEFVDMLARRAGKPPLGPAVTAPLPPFAPDNPRAAAVETERRRRRFWPMAVDVRGPARTGVPEAALEVELLRKMLENAAEVTELRRLRDKLSGKL